MSGFRSRRMEPNRRRRVCTSVVVVGTALIAATHAAAQSAENADLSIGYLNVMGTMHGANVQITRPLTGVWSLVGELNWSRGPDPDSDDYTFNDVGVLGGVRAGWRASSGVFPFVQMLAGPLHSRASGEACYIFSPCRPDSYSVTYVAVQPGAGVTVMLTPRVGLRVQADLQLAITSEYGGGGSLFPRVATGAVIRLGR